MPLISNLIYVVLVTATVVLGGILVGFLDKSTAVFILGERDGIALIDQISGIECLLVNENDELVTSKNLQLNYETKNEVSEGRENIKIVGEN